MKRKAFLKYSALLGMGAVVASVKPLSECMRFSRKLHKISQTQGMMGTWVTITAMHASSAQAEEALGRAFSEMDRVCRLLNRFVSDSALGTLNRDGFLAHIPPELFAVLQRSRFFHKLSGGAFDITVAPLLSLYQETFDLNGGPPGEDRIREVLPQVDGQAVKLKDKSVRFVRDGMTLTLDGIAKGFIVDRGASVLNACGIDHGLINAGGDIRAVGGKNSQVPWRIAVQNPAQRNAVVAYINLSHGAVATSGNYEVYFDSEKLYHHIVRPATGSCAHELSSVTIRASNTMDADALSTTVFVMGSREGVRFIENLQQTQCLILDTRGKRFASRNWKTPWLREPDVTAKTGSHRVTLC